MEEIFSYAKDFQEAMDHEHEKGQLDGIDDEWTFTVWLERYAG